MVNVSFKDSKGLFLWFVGFMARTRIALLVIFKNYKRAKSALNGFGNEIMNFQFEIVNIKESFE